MGPGLDDGVAEHGVTRSVEGGLDWLQGAVAMAYGLGSLSKGGIASARLHNPLQHLLENQSP